MAARTFVADVNKDGLSWCLSVGDPTSTSAVFVYMLCFPVLIENLVDLVSPEIPSVDASAQNTP